MSRYTLILLAALALNSAGCQPSDAPPIICADRAHCPPDTECDPTLGQCVPAPHCQTNLDCCPNAECVGGSCRVIVECDAARPCSGPGRRCVGGRCSMAECVDTSVCGPGQYCLEGRCADDPPCGGCETGTVCDLMSGRCSRGSSECRQLACPPGARAIISSLPQPLALQCGLAESTCLCAPRAPIAPVAPTGDLHVVDQQGTSAVIGHDRRYGDLVVATSDRSWALDGVPTGPVEGDPSGPRGGVRAPGADIGRQLRAVDLSTAGGTGFLLLSLNLERTTPRVVLTDAELQPITRYDLDDQPAVGLALAAGSHGMAAIWSRWSTSAPVYSLLVATTDTLAPQGAASWTVHDLGIRPAAHQGMDCTDCTLLDACVTPNTTPECRLPDLVATCDPCDLDALCIGNQCVPTVGTAPRGIPTIDSPGPTAAISTWQIGTEAPRLGFALYEPRRGTVEWHERSFDAPNVTNPAVRIAGGGGTNVGAGVRAVVLKTGTNIRPIVAVRDVDNRRLLVLERIDLAWSHTLDRPGGRAIDVLSLSDGRAVVAHTGHGGDTVEAWVGPTNWTPLLVPFSGFSGRYLSLARSGTGGGLWLSVTRDRLTSDLMLQTDTVTEWVATE